MIITRLVELLKENTNLTIAKQCLTDILNNEVALDDPAALERDFCYNIYRNRFLMQNELIDKENHIDGYSYLLENLEKTTYAQILVYMIATKNAGFVLFTESNYKKLFGILKNGKTKMEEQILIAEEHKSKGLTSSLKVVNYNLS